MKKLWIGVAGTLAIFGIALMLQGSNSPLAASGAAPADANEVAEAEAMIVEFDLATELQRAVGRDFGGVWFDPSTAQLNVGVSARTSSAAAESVAAELGLEGMVTESPVRSTWAELEAAQERWGSRLHGLFARGEAATSLEADRNALVVELGDLVPASELTAISREAANDQVTVHVQETPHRYLRVNSQTETRCERHAIEHAFCDPELKKVWGGLVGGVTFKSEVVEAKRASCTTGPTVLDKADLTKTYVLTAGHCVEKAKGVFWNKWFAFNKAEEEKEVGTVKAAVYRGSNVDIGVVEVKTGNWAAKGQTPVVPTIAPWNQEEPVPFSVSMPRVPAENMKSCISGQMAATSCGKIVNAAKNIADKNGVELKGLVEVQGVKTFEGDSGAPWYAEQQFKETPSRGFVEGTHVGENEGTENPLFEPLSKSLPALQAAKGLEFELLTEANKVRPQGVVLD